MKRLTLAQMMGLTAVCAVVLGCVVNGVVFWIVAIGSLLFFTILRIGPNSKAYEKRLATRTQRLARTTGNLALSVWIFSIVLIPSRFGKRRC